VKRRAQGTMHAQGSSQWSFGNFESVDEAAW